ncbi:GMC family oxidoreductase [Inquilinus sp. CA228]|uniref:GMC family oxidoreductase n=1 Tax=Inquilinus sp. CA228 TaxID=3455609 RepID=UPI003F8D243E
MIGDMTVLDRRSAPPFHGRSADFVIVGGGSAGCALAGRLSEDPGTTVEVLEEGPRDWSPYIHLPVTYYKTAKGPLLAKYPYQRSQAQSDELNPTMVQARVLGGGSSVNAMLYVRGVPADYDEWAAAGAEGWSYRDVLPYFTRAEDNDRFCNDAHGVGGPLGVSDQQFTHPLTKVWLQACQQAGLPYNDDFNSGRQEGCGLYQITARNGRRSSAAVAYLGDAGRRRNLRINTGCRATRIVVRNGRAIGVEYRKGDQAWVVRAEREVILSTGAFNTPKLLLLSGIGPAEQLRRHGVKVVHDLPGVGRNYQDHMEMSLVYRLTGQHSYDKYKRLGWQAWAGLEYALFRSGPVTSNVAEGGAFWRSSGNEASPDLQLFFLAGAGVEDGVDAVPGGNGCTVSVTQTRPRSRGYVELRGPDPDLPPLIVPNYLTDPHDLACMADGARLAQEIMGQPVLRSYVAGPHVPSRPLASGTDLENFVRKEAHPGLHPCGTCRIGRDDMAVVDPELRVRGIDGLRIADASVMPNIVSGNLNSVAIMIGERAAAFVSGNRSISTRQSQARA